MTSLRPPPVSSADKPAVSATGNSGPSFDHEDMHAFDQVMNGFAAAAPSAVQSPSLISQMVRVPSQAYADGIAAVQAPRPEGMSAVESLDFYAQKQIQLNDLKTLNNMALTVIRMVRKDVETVLNSK